MLAICLKHKPDLLVGTDIVITHVGRLLGIKSVLLNEDDSKEVPLLARFGFRYANATLSPFVCDISPYNKKKVGYNGYHELAYLHPSYFIPDRKKIEHLLHGSGRYFIIRFAKLSAHHDVGKKGIQKEVAVDLINALSPYGNVYITAERSLEPELEKYRIDLDPADMHHALYFADLYVGDSQTMAAEAAVLGTPSIRFNDFVGKVGYLEELEHSYSLTYGIPTTEPERLLEKAREIVTTPSVKVLWGQRRKVMLDSSIDVAAFWIWFLEKFPESMKQVKEDPRGVLGQFSFSGRSESHG